MSGRDGRARVNWLSEHVNHALANRSLAAQVTGADWHIEADERGRLPVNPRGHFALPEALFSAESRAQLRLLVDIRGRK